MSSGTWAVEGATQPNLTLNNNITYKIIYKIKSLYIIIFLLFLYWIITISNINNIKIGLSVD